MTGQREKGKWKPRGWGGVCRGAAVCSFYFYPNKTCHTTISCVWVLGMLSLRSVEEPDFYPQQFYRVYTDREQD